MQFIFWRILVLILYYNVIQTSSTNTAVSNNLLILPNRTAPAVPATNCPDADSPVSLQDLCCNLCFALLKRTSARIMQRISTVCGKVLSALTSHREWRKFSLEGTAFLITHVLLLARKARGDIVPFLQSSSMFLRTSAPLIAE